MSKELDRLRTELRSLASVRLAAHFSVAQARRYGSLCQRELELMGNAAAAVVPGPAPRRRV